MSARRRRGGCAAALLLLSLGCVTPGPVVDTHAWLEVRTPAFSLYSNLEENELLELAGELSLFDAVVRTATSTRIGASRLPARFYVLRDGTQARQFMPPWAAGVIYPTLDGYRSILGGDGSAFWTRQVLLHEYSHYVLRGDRRTPLPRWYDEGTCEFLAYTGVREDVIELGRTATLRLQEIERFGLVPLGDLFDPEGKRIRAFYGTAWALVHHLNTSKELNRQSLAYVERLVRGEDWQTAFEASFEPSLDELEASLEEHVAFLRSGGRRAYLLPLDRVEVPGDLVARPVAPAEIIYQMGELTRRIAERSTDEPRAFRWAQALFQRALELDPDHRRARAALAWSLAAQGRLEQAKLTLAAAGGEGSEDPGVALDVARIAILRAAASDDPLASQAARALLDRAIALDPEAPGAHAELGRLLAAAGDEDGAIAALERARELGAWDPSLDVDLARQYLARGRRDPAVALLRPIANDEHAGELADEARRLLAQAGAQTASSP